MISEHSSRARGKLKIGDDWNAITIIALSQTSPLKAIAELVENSIDAKARTVTITRGREHRRQGKCEASNPVSMTNSTDRVEIITSVQRRRRWTAPEKVRMVDETFEPGMTVSLEARRHGVAKNQLFTWRRLVAQGSLAAAGIGLRELLAALGGAAAWPGREDSNSEMSSQNIPLKGRTDFRGPGRISATETIRV